MLIETAEDYRFYDRVRSLQNLAVKVRTETERTRYGDVDVAQIENWAKFILSNSKPFEYGSMNKLNQYEKSMSRLVAELYK